MAHVSKLFIDTESIYRALRDRYDKKINFLKLKELANEVVCYVVRSGTYITGLITFLTSNGFKVVEIKQDRQHPASTKIAIQMIVDMFKEATVSKEFTICTTNTDLVPPLQYLKESGIVVNLLSLAPMHTLVRAVSTVTEITEDYLYNETDKTERT